MAEQFVSENFVDDFFLKVLEAKNEKHHEFRPVHKAESIKDIDLDKDELNRLVGGAEEIQTLQERQIPVPAPALRTAPSLFNTQRQIPVPPRRILSAPGLRTSKSSNQTNEIDLSKLNEFVQDPQVTLVQCDGPKMPVKITKNNQFLTTDVFLADEEIRAIINRFSFRAQVPLSQPVFRTQVNGLAITAVTSDFSSPRFVIVKK